MRIMEDVREGCDVQPSSPGHAELRPNSEDENEKSTPNETSNVNQNGQNEEVIQEDDKSNENIIKQVNNVGSNDPNEDNYSNDSSPPDNQSTKRKKENDVSLVKRLRSEIQENFTSRDKILNEFLEIMDTSNGNAEQLQLQSEQILSEIKTLNELAHEKEMEWNNIIHVKKIKEELLLRIERRKQISILNFDKQDGDYETQDCFRSSNHSILKANLSTPPKYRPFNSEKLMRNRSLLPRSLQNNLDLNGGLDLRQVRQRPVLDVQTIIADHRQRHPEAVPRRGRRIRNAQSGANGNSSILSFASVALGSGSQMRHNLHDVNNDMNLLLGTMDGNRQDCSRPSSAESATNHQDASSFKDMLVQLAKLSQAERNELIQNAIKPPPPYPEVTVHPVTTTTAAPTNSLLHGILTKSPSKPNNKTSFSPTLARLLTAPERAANSHVTSTPTLASSTHPSNMSISEILSTSKARNEITITPVSSQFETPVKRKSVANMDDDEAEDSADRLVIDEGNEGLENRRSCDNSSDIGDEVPQCQGCNQRAAQFVCAGCGNQWYCSRDCQVSAWDEHSEVCSG